MLAPWKKSYDKHGQHIKKQRHYFANKGPSSRGNGFSSGHVWMWELNCEKSHYGGINGDILQRGLCHIQIYCTQSRCSRPLLTHTSAGDTQTQFWLSLCRVSVSWWAQGLFQPSEHLLWVWDLILNMILPFLLSCWGFFFALGCKVSFFGGIQHSPVDSCSAASCNFGVLAEDERTSLYSTILEKILA